MTFKNLFYIEGTMVGKRAVKSGLILSSWPPVYPPYKSGVKKKLSKSLNRHTPGQSYQFAPKFVINNQL